MTHYPFSVKIVMDLKQRKEAFWWCVKTLGRRNVSWSYKQEYPVTTAVDPGQSCLEWRFRTQEDAVRFQITWQ